MMLDRNFDAWVAIEWLSLDRMLARYGSAGLFVSNPALVMMLSRGVVQARLDAEKIDRRNEALLVDLDHYLESVSKTLGGDESRRLEHWIRYVHLVEVSNPWVPFKTMLGEWSAAYRGGGVDFLGFDCDPRWLADKHRLEVIEACPKGVAGPIRAEELSEWDASLFTRRGFLEIPAGSDFVPFEDDFELAARMHLVQKFTCSVVLEFSMADIRRLDRRMSEFEGVQTWPGVLSLPGLPLLIEQFGTKGRKSP